MAFPFQFKPRSDVGDATLPLSELRTPCPLPLYSSIDEVQLPPDSVFSLSVFAFFQTHRTLTLIDGNYLLLCCCLPSLSQCRGCFDRGKWDDCEEKQVTASVERSGTAALVASMRLLQKDQRPLGA